MCFYYRFLVCCSGMVALGWLHGLYCWFCYCELSLTDKLCAWFHKLRLFVFACLFTCSGLFVLWFNCFGVVWSGVVNCGLITGFGWFD